MTSALTPTLALRYLAELDPAIEGLAVVAVDGTTLAGDPSLAARLGDGGAGAAGLLTARSAGCLLVAEVRPGTLEALVRHDLVAVARELG
jgi:hypothetical protein